jgi:hypothetical protein
LGPGLRIWVSEETGQVWHCIAVLLIVDSIVGLRNIRWGYEGDIGDVESGWTGTFAVLDIGRGRRDRESPRSLNGKFRNPKARRTFGEKTRIRTIRAFADVGWRGLT